MSGGAGSCRVVRSVGPCDLNSFSEEDILRLYVDCRVCMMISWWGLSQSMFKAKDTFMIPICVSARSYASKNDTSLVTSNISYLNLSLNS